MGNKSRYKSSSIFDMQFITSSISTTLVLLLLGLVVFFVLTAHNLSVYVRENISFSILISDDMKEADILKLQKKLNQEPFVKQSEYISKKQALKEQTEAMGTDPEEFLGYNPFTASLEIKLHSVAEKTTPELNEEFARAQGYADLAAMREAVRAKKRKIHEDAADRAAGQELLAKAGANLTVDLPEAMLDRTADNEMRMLEQRLSRSNITLEKHCKNSHTTAAALRAGYRDAAERNLRSMLASRSIAEAENITVSTLEVNNEYRRLSQLQDTPEADIRRVLSPDTLAAALVAQKVQRFLLDNADITTVMDPEKE